MMDWLEVVDNWLPLAEVVIASILLSFLKLIFTLPLPTIFLWAFLWAFLRAFPWAFPWPTRGHVW